MVHVDNEAGVPHYWGKTGKGLQKLITIVATTDFLLFGYGKLRHSGVIAAQTKKLTMCFALQIKVSCPVSSPHPLS